MLKLNLTPQSLLHQTTILTTCLMHSKIFFALTVVASCAFAHGDATETSAASEPSASLPAGISPCILSCVTTAAQSVGCTFTDTSCVCTSTQFQSEAQGCLQANCTAQDLQAALALQAQECGSIGATPSGSSSGTVTGSATTEATASSTEVSTGASTGASVSVPVSVPVSAPSAPVSSSAGQGSSVRPTLTVPVTSHSGTSIGSTSAPASTSSSAAMGKGDGMGFFGLIVAGFFGLML
ncbi:hypothetical protein E4T56_gene8528 [Termitomyces sp. T112]|nr:hypothetical protein E4T56_gene8528 [Termitomyces sp. T112]